MIQTLPEGFVLSTFNFLLLGFYIELLYLKPGASI